MDLSAANVAFITSFGFVFATRENFNLRSPQAERDGIKETPGAWGVYDPLADSEGWALVGDDPEELCRETMEELSYSSGIKPPKPEGADR
jgi:hypothetical protein